MNAAVILTEYEPTQRTDHSIEAELSVDSGGSRDKVAFIQRLKALSRQHVSDMEKSKETTKTDDETPSQEDEEGYTEEKKIGENRNLLPQVLASIKTFDIAKYANRFSSSLPTCALSCADSLNISNFRLERQDREYSFKRDVFELTRTSRNRRREREERAVELDDIIVTDDHTTSEMSAITMQTLQVQDFKMGLKARKDRRELLEQGEDFQSIRKHLRSDPYSEKIHSDDVPIEDAISTLQTISEELGVPVKELLKDRGLRKYLQRMKS